MARNTAISGARTLVRLLVGFALLPILLHDIGSVRTGLFLFATTLTGYFTAVDVSVTSSVTRYVAEHRARGLLDELIGTVRSAVLVMAGFGCLAAVALVLVAVTSADALFSEPALRSSAEPTLLVAAATSALYWPSRIGVAVLNGIERYDQSAAVQIVSSVLLLAGLGWMAHMHASVTLLCGAFGALSVLEGVASAALAWRPLKIDRRWLEGGWWHRGRLGGVFRFGAAAFLIGISDTLINSFDRAVVGAIVGAGAIVGYDAAQRPQNAVKTFSGLAGFALVSPVARLEALERRDRMRELVLIASFVSIAITAPIAVLVMVVARPLVVAWLGSGYGHYAPYVIIFVSYWALNCSTAALSSALYGIGRLDTYARIIFATAAIALPLSIGLTYAWGTVGVIWGTVIPSVIFMPVFAWHALRLLGIPPTRFARTVLIPGFGRLLSWSALVVAARLLVAPSGYAGLAAFSAAALAAAGIIFAPPVLTRIRAARAQGLSANPDPPGGPVAAQHGQGPDRIDEARPERCHPR